MRKEGEVVAQSADIQFLHLKEKPKKSIMSRRYDQFTVSNALEMSNLMKRAGTFFYGESPTMFLLSGDPHELTH